MCSIYSGGLANKALMEELNGINHRRNSVYGFIMQHARLFDWEKSAKINGLS